MISTTFFTFIYTVFGDTIKDGNYWFFVDMKIYSFCSIFFFNQCVLSIMCKLDCRCYFFLFQVNQTKKVNNDNVIANLQIWDI